MWATPRSTRAAEGANFNSKTNASAVYSRSIVSKHQGSTYTLPSKSPTTNLAYRNYVKDVEKLRKELDRKDARNANIAQEMQQLRTKFSNQERELRILSGTFEKCNNERVKFQADLTRTKEYADKLELQLARLGDSVAMVQTVDKLQLTNEHYASELANLKGVLAFKDEKMVKMEKELEALERAVDVQTKYEAEGVAGGNAEGKDASLKSLYYELGKRQTDAHSLAISLAGTNKELKDAKEATGKAQAAQKEMELHFKQAKSHSTALIQQADKDKEEITSLHDKLANLKGLNTRLQGMVEDLSKRLREEREDFLKYKQEKDSNEQELLHTLDNANKEIHHLRLRVKNLDDAVKLSDSKRVRAEELVMQEARKFDDERRVYAAKIKDGIHASDQNKVLNMQLASAMKGTPGGSAAAADKSGVSGASGWSPRSPAHSLTAKLEGQVKALEADLEAARESEKELLHDREASVRALQQTIEATRELSARHGDEKAKRVAAEQRISAAEERAARAERELAMYMQSDNNVRTSRDNDAGAGAGAGANKGVSFVGESEIFAPPVPPPQQQQQLQDASTRSSQERAAVRPTSAHTSAKHSPGRGSSMKGTRGGGESQRLFRESSGNTATDNLRADLRDSRDSVMSDTSAISTTSTAASSVADELARLRAELREIEDQKPK